MLKNWNLQGLHQIGMKQAGVILISQHQRK